MNTEEKIELGAKIVTYFITAMIIASIIALAYQVD